MEWSKFNTHGQSNNKAFEVMCNILFRNWCYDEYGDSIERFAIVNGDGGDGGVEAYAETSTGDIIGVQSKWFFKNLDNSQISQIRNSFRTALEIRPNIKKYIVCIPRNLTSSKKVKNNGVAKNTEEYRWAKLVEDLNKDYPEVNIVLWDETTIQMEMSKPHSQGCYKFWFDSTVLFNEEVLSSFQKAISSWARANYVHDLYSTGYMNKKLEMFLGSYSDTIRKIEHSHKIIHRLEALTKAYEDILRIDFDDENIVFTDAVSADIDVLRTWVSELKNYEQLIKDGAVAKCELFANPIDLQCSLEMLKSNRKNHSYYYHFNDAELLLDGLIDDVYDFCRQAVCNLENKIIFIGNPGTGKTTGIVSEAETLISSRTHLPILVNAKDYRNGDNWRDIIVNALGLDSEWSERDVFMALENAALSFYSSDILQGINIQPKCVICVDGIDESASYSFWKERIEETSRFCVDYPSIKFVFLSRPYVFREYYKLSYSECFFRLPETGDVGIDDIFDTYLDYYNIRINENAWIKNVLRTPLALKLFCEIYNNRNIEKLDSNSLMITHLMEKKLDLLCSRFNEKTNQFNNNNEISTVLIIIAQLLTQKDFVDYSEVYCACKEYDISNLHNVLEFLELEGMIQSIIVQEDVLDVSKKCYSWGSQPAFDYLLANKLYKAIKSGIKIDTEYTDGIFQMLALLTVEKDGKLIHQYDELELENSVAFEYICYSLSNASIGVAENYVGYLIKLMEYSPGEFREIVNKIIIPCSKIHGHPLGAVLLDTFLKKFEKPAERDIWWSIPTYLRYGYNSNWRCYSEIDDDSLKIMDNESFVDTPLIVAWRLSSVDNRIRRECRLRLLSWGINNSMEFFDLLSSFAEVNDLQILEDLFAIAYGISLNKQVSHEFMEIISTWILNNVFSNKGLIKYENTYIRHYCKGIVAISRKKGLCDDDAIKCVTPPFSYKVSAIKIANEALDSDRMGGFGPINYDLARYVLCDPFDKFLLHRGSDEEDKNDVIAFLNDYKSTFNLDKLSMDSFLISAAYEFLKECGWNVESFWACKDNENTGIDIAIGRSHMHATHGAASTIMTVAEKYIWIARHVLGAIITNRFKMKTWGGKDKFLSDYSEVEYIPSVYHDYLMSSVKNNNQYWLNITEIAKGDESDFSMDSIANWINNSQLPDFDIWVNRINERVILYSFSHVNNEKLGVCETLWISSGIIEEASFEQFVQMIDQYFENRNELMNVADFHAYIDCNGYCSPEEACTVYSNNEVESKLNVGFEDENIELIKTVTRCLAHSNLDNEEHIIIPSKILREKTGIVYGDGIEYYDCNDEVMGIATDAGENWRNQQTCLMIDSDKLGKTLKEEGCKMFWLYRVQRNPSNKANELFTELSYQRSDRTFIVWIEKGVCYSKELKDVEIPNRESSLDFSDLILIANEYGE